MIITEEGKYQWLYQLDMKNNKSIFRLVIGIILISFGIVAAFLLVLDIVEGNSIIPTMTMMGGILAVLLVITWVAYKIVAHRYKNVYGIIYEMDDEGIRFSQVEDQQQFTELIGKFAALAGALSHNYSLMGSAFAMTDNSAYSNFSKVTRIVEKRQDNLIEVISPFLLNMVYVDEEHYDFVLEFIKERCPKTFHE